MADDQDKQDDDKQEFTPEGETLGYISLDQARVLALQHARDNREFYGRYAYVSLSVGPYSGLIGLLEQQG